MRILLAILLLLGAAGYGAVSLLLLGETDAEKAARFYSPEPGGRSDLENPNLAPTLQAEAARAKAERYAHFAQTGFLAALCLLLAIRLLKGELARRLTTPPNFRRPRLQPETFLRALLLMVALFCVVRMIVVGLTGTHHVLRKIQFQQRFKQHQTQLSDASWTRGDEARLSELQQELAQATLERNLACLRTALLATILLLIRHRIPPAPFLADNNPGAENPSLNLLLTRLKDRPPLRHSSPPGVLAARQSRCEAALRRLHAKITAAFNRPEPAEQPADPVAGWRDNQ